MERQPTVFFLFGLSTATVYVFVQFVFAKLIGVHSTWFSLTEFIELYGNWKALSLAAKLLLGAGSLLAAILLTTVVLVSADVPRRVMDMRKGPFGVFCFMLLLWAIGWAVFAMYVKRTLGA